ncbi:MAG: APC family permease, partial [Cryobacterium sp.]
ENIFQTLIAPILATIGLILGEYLLMSRFGLLAGTVAEGVDPTVTPWGLSGIGWVLVVLPFALLAGGYALLRTRKSENESLVRDVLS